VVAETPGRIATISPALKTATIIASATPGYSFIPGVAISPAFIAWANQKNSGGATSSVSVYNRFLESQSNITLALPGKIASLQWMAPNILGILTQDGFLYRYDVGSASLRKTASGVKSFIATGDGATLAALEQNAIEVFSFAANAYYRFALPNNAEIKSLSWYRDGNHLFVEYPDHVSFLDIADKALNNFLTIENGTAPHYDADENALYMIDPVGSLTRFDFSK